MKGDKHLRYKESGARKRRADRYCQSDHGKTVRDRAQKAYRKTPEGQQVLHVNKLKFRYGLTVEQYGALLIKQGGVCAICSGIDKIRLAVDHCHIQNKVRGLLCRKCNVGLGHFHDDIRLLEKAIIYLKGVQ